MTIFLDRLDAAPVFGDEFSYPFAQWLSVLVNTLDEITTDIQNYFNLLKAQGYTSIEINAMFVAGDLTNGMLLYDTDLNVYVGVQNNALVKFTTTAYP